MHVTYTFRRRLARAGLALAVTLGVGACSETVVTVPGPAADEPPADPVAAPSPDATCPPGQYAAPPSGACAALPSLTIARSNRTIAPARDHHTTHVIEVGGAPYLYVFAGTDGWRSLHTDVQRAPIGPDGALGAFENVGTLPEGRAGHCIIVKGDRLFILGGVVGTERSGPSKSTLTARVGSDGKIVDIAEGPSLPIAVMHLTCAAHDDTLYAFGGRGVRSRSTTLSARAKMNADGSLGAFEEEAPLSPDRSHHATFVRNGRVYLMGGLTGDPTKTSIDRQDVVSAEILAGGRLGPWTAAGALASPLSVSAALLRDDVVWVLGGYEGADAAGYTDRVQRGTFAKDGSIASFEVVDAKLPQARAHVHQTPVYGKHLYSVAGKSSEQEPVGTIDIGTFE